jgi:hypothetical protein
VGYSTQLQQLTEEYNGSSWTSNPPGLNTARHALAAAGTQTSALAFGGYTPGYTGATEEYDGNSWTSVNSMNTARSNLAGAGIQTAALAFGGDTGSPPNSTAATEEYDGTSWTTSPGSINNSKKGFSRCRYSIMQH